MTLTRQPYTECKLYVDGCPGLAVDHYITTPGGSAYLVTKLRLSTRTPGRKNLTCLRWPIAEVPAGAVRHEIHWYPRKKKGARRHARP